LLDAVPDLPWPANPQKLAQIRGEITIDHVSFQHGDGRQVLSDASLRIPAGQHVALLGANGSGKTTLATLLPRLRDVDAGSVRIDGVDVRKLGAQQLRSAVALVFQETVLFDATLRENIVMGRPEASTQEVEAAAKCAGVTVYSDRWKDGLETEVGERGAGLSGGERQRVALARALVRDAAIVVLDEPTTGLDAANEERLCTEVLARLRGKTVLLITHNPRVLDAVDRVVRIVDGKLVDVDKRTGEQLLTGDSQGDA
jgi:ATP-binding cassette subfamily B protein